MSAVLPELMPLSDFPAEMRARIEEQAEADTPPPKWIELGPSDSARAMARIPSRAYHEWHLRRGRDLRARPFREPIPDGLRAAVVSRDGHICQLCQDAIAKGEPYHLDHITPVSLGGRTKLSNLQMAHPRCNLLKGARA